MQSHTDFYLIHVTVADAYEPLRLARMCVEKRLAACGNVINAIRSVFRWEGAVQEAEEAVLVLKTTGARLSALKDAIAAAHSYDCPCIIALRIADGYTPFLEWIAATAR